MYGRTDLTVTLVILILGFTAAVTDGLRGKIYNWLTFPGVIAGVAYGFYMHGASGAGDALLGVAVGLVAYGWMFMISMMGAGDVKLLMAFGAWGGWSFALETSVIGVIIGGAMAVGILVAKGRFGAFYRKMLVFVASLFARGVPVEVPQVDRKLTMPYGIPIALAAAWVRLVGVNLW